ncbi:MAG: alpha/beta fold hydrolase [Bacteroidetes bacterium]|nr:MAG: alpha/beta fold hydrolase [Bacteroidota bacterium]
MIKMNNKLCLFFKSVTLFLVLHMLMSCHGMKNSDRPIPKDNEKGAFITVRDGIKIFVYEYVPGSDFKNTIYIVSGITGINHNSEKEIIEILSNNENRVIVIHPRGTGYSEGKRGDGSNLSDFITDYIEIINSDKYYHDSKRKIILFGHSMSCAIALKVAGELRKTDGLILVNPPYRLKSTKGMTPGVGDYLRYIGYYIFAPHIPVVNMAGDPSVIENEADRRESEVRNNDPLLVKYFSMHYMSESKKIMDEMVENAKQADYPLLLLYGDNDMIVDKAGCDEIFAAWKNQKRDYEIINGGSHGKSTVVKGAEIIIKWIEGI